jgi:hypothetical protein
MHLLSAACDPAFAWPLRQNLVAASSPPAHRPDALEAGSLPPPSQPQTIVMAQAPAALPPGVPPPPPDLMPATAAPPAPAEAQPAEESATPRPPPRSQPQTILMPRSPAAPPPAPSAPPAVGGYDVQVARGPSKEGASRALDRARKTMGGLPAGAFGRVETGEDRGRPRYTAVVAGFPTPEAALAACGVLQAAGQTCFVRDLPKEPESAIATSVPRDAHAVQVARGPSQDGARRALAAARKTLGPSAADLTDAIEESRVGSRRRFTAVLAGFASEEAADAACDTLVAAGQLCLTRSRETTVAARPIP